MYVVQLMMGNGNVRFLEDFENARWTADIDRALKFDDFESAYEDARCFIGGFAKEIQ